jgi:hypothetical protein
MNSRKHGGWKSSEYTIWAGIKQRCLNPKSPSFHNYGGRGIRVCNSWNASFENFLADMGPRPSKAHSIDRIDPNGDYMPENCRWATTKEQRANKRPNKWQRIVLLLAADAADEVSAMVAANEPDELISQHIARTFKPEQLEINAMGAGE